MFWSREDHLVVTRVTTKPCCARPFQHVTAELQHPRHHKPPAPAAATAAQARQSPADAAAVPPAVLLLRCAEVAGKGSRQRTYSEPVVLMMSESPGSVMASTLTRKYLPQAVPRSTLSAAGSSSSSRHLRPHHIMKHSQTCVDKAVHQRSAVPCSVGCRQSRGSDTGG